MTLLDENILAGQRVILDATGVAVRQIGYDFASKGLKDDDIVVMLRSQNGVTFFTRDIGFYSPALRHARYCVVALAVAQNEVSVFVRRFLRHPQFNTKSKRLGAVVRISHTGIWLFRLRSQSELHVRWDER